jgi:hypothetical protein
VLVLRDEGVYLVYVRRPGFPPRFSVRKVTIDRTPPVLSLMPLNQRGGGVLHAAFGRRGFGVAAAADTSPVVLDRPGQLRLGAVDRLSGVDGIEYRLDGSDLTAYSDDVSFVRTLVVPGVGTHTITVVATDVAGNRSVMADQTFQVQDSATPSPSPSPIPTPTRRPTPTPVTATPTPTPTPAPTPTPLFVITATVRPTSVTTTACPVTFTFTATITYVGTAPVTLSYVWNRSDGAIQTTPDTISFTGPTSQPVPLASTTWTLGAAIPLFQPFNGWEQVQLASQPVTLSNRANFTLTCNQVVIG